MGRGKSKKKPVTLAGKLDPMVVPVRVEDPYGRYNPKVVAMRATRDDPLARMRAHSHIDDAQYEAGRAYQRDWERAERGPKAIDPGKEAVDGGHIPEGITDDQLTASDNLSRVIDGLGADGINIVHDVLISGFTTVQLAAKRGYKGQYWEKHFGRVFRGYLEELAVIYNFAQPSR